jgi:hypothetical protein
MFMIVEEFEDCRGQDGTNTSLVFSRTHIKPGKEVQADEHTEAKGRSTQEGKRRALQCYLTDNPNEEGMEHEVEDHHTYTYNLWWWLGPARRWWVFVDQRQVFTADRHGHQPVFTLSVEFRGVNEEVTQLRLGSKEPVFEKLEKLSQHLRPLNIQGRNDRRPISRMLIDAGAAVNLMPYSVFKKLGWEDDEFVKANLMLNDVWGTRWRQEVSSPWSSS